MGDWNDNPFASAASDPFKDPSVIVTFFLIFYSEEFLLLLSLIIYFYMYILFCMERQLNSIPIIEPFFFLESIVIHFLPGHLCDRQGCARV